MNLLASTLAAVLTFSNSFAGITGLTRTLQPLDGQEGHEGIQIESVTCYDRGYGTSLPTAIYLIAAPNHPPYTGEHASPDLNIASVCGIKFEGADVDGGDKTIVLNAENFKKHSSLSNSEVARACLECLRRNLKKEHMTLPVEIKASEENLAWLKPVVEEFNKHDRTKPFYPQEDH